MKVLFCQAAVQLVSKPEKAHQLFGVKGDLFFQASVHQWTAHRPSAHAKRAPLFFSLENKVFTFRLPVILKVGSDLESYYKNFRQLREVTQRQQFYQSTFLQLYYTVTGSALLPRLRALTTCSRNFRQLYLIHSVAWIIGVLPWSSLYVLTGYRAQTEQWISEIGTWTSTPMHLLLNVSGSASSNSFSIVLNTTYSTDRDPRPNIQFSIFHVYQDNSSVFHEGRSRRWLYSMCKTFQRNTIKRGLTGSIKIPANSSTNTSSVIPDKSAYIEIISNTLFT